jgi:hypothetical protein
MIYYRQSLYVAFLVISGFSALALPFLYTKIDNKSPTFLEIDIQP